jgi:hypothetical protein
VILSGPIQPYTNNFWVGELGSLIIWSPGYGLRPKTACFKEIYLFPAFLSYSDVTYISGSLLIWGKGHHIGSKWVGTFITMNTPPSNQILRTYLRPLGDLGDPSPKCGSSENFRLRFFEIKETI